jgi:hypothetical protein
VLAPAGRLAKRKPCYCTRVGVLTGGSGTEVNTTTRCCSTMAHSTARASIGQVAFANCVRMLFLCEPLTTTPALLAGSAPPAHRSACCTTSQNQTATYGKRQLGDGCCSCPQPHPPQHEIQIQISLAHVYISRTFFSC